MLTGQEDEQDHRVASWLIWCWSALLAVVLLGPALARGFLLRYDMVWVPDLALRSDVIGLGSALPRAVPSDAVVAVLDEVVPGELLQKVVLLGALTVAAAGGAALLRAHGVTAQLVAASLYVWNPYVVERLLIGHWPVLVGYAVLPWLLVWAAQWRVRATTMPPWQLLALVPLGSLSIGAGLVSAVVLLVSAAVGGVLRARRTTVTALLVIAANAPWLVAGLLHGSGAQSDPLGAEMFALRGEGMLPAPLTALGLGGVWNAEVVPGSRTGVLAVVALLVVGVLALLGLVRLWRARAREDAGVLPRVWASLWLVGWGLACWTWVSPTSVGWVAEHLPGGGVLRDGARFLALCAPALTVAVAVGCVVLLEAMQRMSGGDRGKVSRGARTPQLVNAFFLIMLPVALLPDAAWGAGGELRPVAYPDVYAEVRDVVGDADGGLVLVLPYSSYRAPEWNHAVKVLDPVSRVLTSRSLYSDELVVSGQVVAGEDRFGPRVHAALAEEGPSEVARALAQLGVSRVTVEEAAPGTTAEIDGRVLFDDDGWQVLAIPDPTAVEEPSASRVTVMVMAWSGFVGLFAMAGWGAIAARRRRHVSFDTRTW